MTDTPSPLSLDAGLVTAAVARSYVRLVAGLAGLGLALAVMLAVGTQADRDAERIAGGGAYAGVLTGALAAQRARPLP